MQLCAYSGLHQVTSNSFHIKILKLCCSTTTAYKLDVNSAKGKLVSRIYVNTTIQLKQFRVYVAAMGWNVGTRYPCKSSEMFLPVTKNVP